MREIGRTLRKYRSCVFIGIHSITDEINQNISYRSRFGHSYARCERNLYSFVRIPKSTLIRELAEKATNSLLAMSEYFFFHLPITLFMPAEFSGQSIIDNDSNT